MTAKRTLPTSEPEITRFVINRTTKNVNYTVEGFGQVVKGAAAPGTTPLRVMIQFLADYAPASLESVPECLAKLQQYSDFVLEWEIQEGILFENGALVRFPVTATGQAVRSDERAAWDTQRDGLEQLKKRIGYGKYALSKEGPS